MQTEQNNLDNAERGRSADTMNTLSGITVSAVKKGFTENFSVEDGKLQSPSSGKAYTPQEVRIDNFYRFEGASDPADNAILYCMETNDGTKGMLIDSYGHDADVSISEFIKKIEEMHKAEAEG